VAMHAAAVVEPVVAAVRPVVGVGTAAVAGSCWLPSFVLLPLHPSQIGGAENFIPASVVSSKFLLPSPPPSRRMIA
jgi:hypothetical protein